MKKNSKNNIFKRFFSWITSASSDFILFILVLVLANMVGQRAFVRLDLTTPKSYSLSEASRQIVRTIEEPLSVKVFFSSNLPAPYNTVEQYLRDLLVEYKGAAGKNLSYEFFNMEKPENETLAQNYNLKQIQIQEVKNNEVGFRNAFMGLVIVYSDRIEIMDSLLSSDGLEYKLTTAISKMIATTDTLAGLKDKVNMTLYISKKLSSFGISGIDKVEKSVVDAYSSVNRKNMDRISYQSIDPSEVEITDLSKKYGLQTVNWTEDDGSKGLGIIGLVLEYNDKFRTVPLGMARSLFGYAVTGLDKLEEDISNSLQGLVSKSLEIGYIIGHGENDIYDSQKGAGRLENLTSDMYEFIEINLGEEDIPSNIQALVINGPKTYYSDSELYKIDQFLMKGGNIMLFMDPFTVTTPEGQNAYYQGPQYEPIFSRLEEILTKYGIKTGQNYILDQQCYEANQQGYGKLSLYWVPVVKKDGIDKKNVITKNLGYLLFLQNSSIDITLDEKQTDVKATVLVKSSPDSWLMSDNIVLNPMYITPPGKEERKSQNLAVLLEGNFSSAYDKAPVNSEGESEKTNETISNIETETHLTKSIQKGKIFVAGSSYITSSQVIDENGTEPISIFIRNVIDYMNGAEDLCSMRTKGLSLDSLTIKNPALANVVKIFNQYGIAVLVVLLGVILWRIREIRRRKIRMLYDPDDSREEENC